jgi:CBS domain containing-hemolysin-like protein
MTFEFQIILLLVCLLGTFVFAGTETGFVSWNRLKVSHLAETGSRMGQWGLFLINRKNSVLSAVLICSNVSIVGASLSFNSLFSHVSQFSLFSKIPSPESWLLTPVVVLFCEMLPKSLFRLYSFQLTLRFIPLLLIVYYCTLPFSYLFSTLTGGFRKTVADQDQTFITKIREEMILVTAEGARTGALFESSNLLFSNILQLKNRTVSELMLALNQFQKVQFKVTDTISMIKKCKIDTGEVIIYDVNGVIPVGYISLLDIIAGKLEDSLSSFVRPLLVVDEDITLVSGLKMIIKDPRNLFLLRNKEGIIKGVLNKKDLYRAVFSNQCLELQNVII